MVGGILDSDDLVHRAQSAVVMLITPLLLAWWRASVKRPDWTPVPTQRMATAARSSAVPPISSWPHWRAGGRRRRSLDVVRTVLGSADLGELSILPTGLGLFARLAPQRFGATTVASWFLATFAGNLASAWWNLVGRT